jgi:hypothetical protein
MSAAGRQEGSGTSDTLGRLTIRRNTRESGGNSDAAIETRPARPGARVLRAVTVGDPQPAPPPRLLIVTGNLSLLRGHYEGVIVGLVQAGVHVSVRYLKEGALSLEEYRATLSEAGVDVDVRAAPRRGRRPADVFGLRLRELGNILRYAHPDYAGKVVLAERALEKTGAAARFWGRRIRRLGPRRAAAAARAIAWLETSLPAPAYAARLLEEERPDAVAVVPVIRAPVLIDYLKAAVERGLGTSIWVQSWDNLTNKGLVHFAPDKVFVWNETQRDELGRYHGVGADRVCVTGAQTFDHWFDGTAVPSRADFCAELRIDAERPIILYLASSRGIAPEEPAFFGRWLEAVRSSSDPVLSSATVLLRPHPTLSEAWHACEFDRQPGVVVSPATIRDALNSSGFREQYRSELHHASVVFGINTSGVIDAAIFGKPALTVELPELFHGQHGTVHFEHVAAPDTGLLRTAASMGEHLAMLGEFVRRDPYAQDERSAAFIRRFVRPRGLDSQPAQIFVEELVDLCRTRATIAPPAGVARVTGSSVSFLVATIGSALLLPKRLARLSRRAVKRARRILRLRTNARRALRLAGRAVRLAGRGFRRARRPVTAPPSDGDASSPPAAENHETPAPTG